MAGINMTPANIYSPRFFVGWHDYWSFTVSEHMGYVSSVEFRLRSSQRRSVK